MLRAAGFEELLRYFEVKRKISKRYTGRVTTESAEAGFEDLACDFVTQGNKITTRCTDPVRTESAEAGFEELLRYFEVKRKISKRYTGRVTTESAEAGFEELLRYFEVKRKISKSIRNLALWDEVGTFTNLDLVFDLPI